MLNQLKNELNKALNEFLIANRRAFSDSSDEGEANEFIFDFVQKTPLLSEVALIDKECFAFFKAKKDGKAVYIKLLEEDSGPASSYFSFMVISEEEFEQKRQALLNNIDYYTYCSFFERY